MESRRTQAQNFSSIGKINTNDFSMRTAMKEN
jgi:hypothetical protein